MSSAPRAPATWTPTDDLVRLDHIVMTAPDDVNHAADHLAAWFDRQTTHHEGSDAARILDDWAYDPSADNLDTLAWHVQRSNAPLPDRVTMMAVLAGALARMGD
jgi:hypothetical protein